MQQFIQWNETDQGIGVHQVRQQWSYAFLALTHRYMLSAPERWSIIVISFTTLCMLHDDEYCLNLKKNEILRKISPEIYSTKLLYAILNVKLVLSIRIFYTEVPDYTTDCPCSVWHRGLTHVSWTNDYHFANGYHFMTAPKCPVLYAHFFFKHLLLTGNSLHPSYWTYFPSKCL